MALNKESRSYIFIMAVVLCIACSIVVSGAAVSLRSQQEKNQLLDQRANVLNVVGLYRKGMDVNETFNERIETKVIDLETGEEVSGVDPAAYDMFKAAKQSGSNVTLSSEQDIAGIGSIPKKAIVYVVRDEQGEVLNYVFPVAGYGLWSTMYAYVAVQADGNTIDGITFYDHGETPGLGGEISNPKWQEQWDGKEIYNEDGEPAFRLVKGGVEPQKPGSEHKVDALSGATLTSNGVTNLMQFWFSDMGYKSFIARQARG
ncbi:Na(+)-translocating NADH-quinone reductase subunit C [Algiphilus sp.]|uniref:Na(+)-translocating NADH-quinone reductase subunit C n=1 Tax=Algiphilus sp. TaxID=1872431 RepID=UPI003B5264AD